MPAYRRLSISNISDNHDLSSVILNSGPHSSQFAADIFLGVQSSRDIRHNNAMDDSLWTKQKSSNEGAKRGKYYVVIELRNPFFRSEQYDPDVTSL